MDRRKFLLTIPAAGAALPAFGNEFNTNLNISGDRNQLANEFLRISADPSTGRFSVFRNNGIALVTDASARILNGTEYVSLTDKRFTRSVEKTPFYDALGKGNQLIIHAKDREKKLDLQLRLSLYSGESTILVMLSCKNTSADPLNIRQTEPLFALPEVGASLSWPGTSRLLTNGAMYYDPGSIIDFSIPDPKIHHSWWNIALFSGYKAEGLVCGALENRLAQGQLLLRRAEQNRIGITLLSVLAPGFTLQPGNSCSSNNFMLHIGPDPYSALETYATAMGKMQHARTHSIINGWCNWFYTYEHITAAEVLHNAGFIARELKSYGMEYVQVDEGYQRWHGDWEGNERFPERMKMLADRIKALGLKPGIWIAPYTISEHCELFQKHPEWLLRKADGSFQRVGPWPSEESDWAKNEKVKRYGLDITNPGAAQWLYDLFDTLANKWGYEMIKIDFVDWSLLSAHAYHDPAVSRAAVYRKGFEIMRKAVGNNVHLQDCGPGPVTVGLLDTMRIELDQNYGYRKEVWKQYFQNPTSSAPAAAKRYYFHKRTWINDADHVCLHLLSVEQAKAAATLIALTGGNVISGDRLPELDATRLDILRKILPSTGEAARPVDLFDSDVQSIFALQVKKSFGEWTIAAFFNNSASEISEKTIPLERLGLDPSKNYLAWDFWKEQLTGEFTGDLQVVVAPESVCLLYLHEKKDHPFVIATNRHVIMGVHELQMVGWDAVSGRFTGNVTGIPGTNLQIAVYIPGAQAWKQGGTALYHDQGPITFKMIDEHVMRMHVRIENTGKQEWDISLNDFFRQ
jgi:hypothetical protein